MTSRRNFLKTATASALTLTGIGTATAHGGGHLEDENGNGTTKDDAAKTFQAVREATAKYHSVEQAKVDGYHPHGPCVPGMGQHFVNKNLLGDGEAVPEKPEVLLYEPTAGGYKLVGVEYLVFENNAESRPSLFGQPFDGPMSHGMPPHYDLHAWVWKENPNGLFAPTNPNVDC